MKFAKLGLVAALLAGMAGCGDINLRGKQIKAQYTLPEKGQMLVLVWDRPGSGVPLDVSSRLAMGITKHLGKFTKTHDFVNPDLVTPLKQNAQEYSKMDVMSIARKTGAQYVLVVDLYEFRADQLSSGLLTSGNAQALIRVVDRDGVRMWPAREGNPVQIQTDVRPGTSDQQTLADVKTKLISDLGVKVGRVFHDYGTDEMELNPKN
jgi:hypothetical protein